jgi:hypothetical protein
MIFQKNRFLQIAHLIDYLLIAYAIVAGYQLFSQYLLQSIVVLIGAAIWAFSVMKKHQTVSDFRFVLPDGSPLGASYSFGHSFSQIFGAVFFFATQYILWYVLHNPAALIGFMILLIVFLLAMLNFFLSLGKNY